MDWDTLAKVYTANGIPALRGQALAPYTTFKIGGPAALFCRPETNAQLAAALRLAKGAGARVYLLGKGSNVLFADEGFDGVVIQIGPSMGGVEIHGSTICAGAGEPLSQVCLAAAEAGLTGLEFAYGIPGSVGGAVYMNAGAYGGEMKDVLEDVAFLDDRGGEHTLPAGELCLSYRTSIFTSRPWCILCAKLRLSHGDRQAVRARMDELAHRRAEKQPLDLPSAGSTFKRPAGAFAGALIDQCGLRGYQVGGAAISEKHCGFVVNLGGATCADVLALTDHVQAVVRQKTGYDLEREVRVVR